MIVDESGFYDCRYGTFLSNSEREKHILQLRERTIRFVSPNQWSNPNSLWTHLNHATNIVKYQNTLYDISNVMPVLTPSAAPNKIVRGGHVLAHPSQVFWSGLYDRSEGLLSPPSFCYVHERLVEIVESNKKGQERRLTKALGMKRENPFCSQSFRGGREIQNRGFWKRQNDRIFANEKWIHARAAREGIRKPSQH